MYKPIVLHGDWAACLDRGLLVRRDVDSEVALSFLDPPFNQSKDYEHHNDKLPKKQYWEGMQDVCRKIHELTCDGGAIYFMQREKNVEFVMRALRRTGWTFQNLLVWKKMTSAVPSSLRFGKAHQIIAFATKGKRPRLFNRLRIDPPLLANHKYERPNGMYVTDVWDDVRELTSGYFAGDEALRREDGTRLHKQQSPIHLLLRIILSSTAPGDLVLDPFAGTGTTLVVSRQLNRESIGVELSRTNVEAINMRIREKRDADSVHRFFANYACTPDLEAIWGSEKANSDYYLQGEERLSQPSLLEAAASK